jgi:predicted dehydrogenase
MFKDKTIGIIGAGEIVFVAHLPFLKAMGTKPEWIVDISEKAAGAASKSLGIPQALTPDQLEKAAPTDVVLVACPYGVRQPYYDFLKGKNSAIYIEKPIAKSIRELESIAGLRDESAICAGFQRRSMGIVNVVKGIIEDGLFGQLRHVRSNFGTVTQISSGGGFAKNVKLAGGGQLLESAVHNIDAICYMANVSNAHVLTKNMIHENGFDLHTEAVIELTDAGDRKIEFELLVTCFQSTGYEIIMQFDRGILTFSLFRDMKPEVKALNSQRSFRISDAFLNDYPQQQYDVMYVFWRDFMKAVETGKPNYTNLSSSLVTTQIIEQLYQ